MPQATYFMEIECTATPSDLHKTLIVTVVDDAGHEQFLRVAQGFLTEEAGRTYLPIRLIELDRAGGRALVQLPYEADSGVNRLWVGMGRFRRAASPEPAGTPG
jgi:hypothetical protein